MLPPVPFGEALRVWVRVGLQSFGGPAAQIAVMHRILVEEKRWIDEHRFLHALNYCMLLPGPEATQLATYIGWLLHGHAGGLAAGVLFVLPGFLAILTLSILYAAFAGLGTVAALFFGLKAAVLAVVVQAVIRIGRRVLDRPVMIGVAALAFVAIFLFDAPFPFIVLGAGLVGLVGYRLLPGQAAPASQEDARDEREDRAERRHTRPSAARAVRVLVVCALLWVAPVVALGLIFGAHSVYVDEAVFFSKTAVVTFGGAYAVLAYIAQQAVDNYGWLYPGEMLDGLAMAETTPGPLIMVVQFVGFLGAYRHPGPLDPMAAGILGSLVTTWVTFVPCFLWIFLGAPYVELLRGNRRLAAALSTITAAVVGVILNLAVWFALHVVFAEVDERSWLGMRLLVPRWDTIDVAALVLTAAAGVAVLRFRAGILVTLGGCMILGLLYRLVIG
jgi:chromate transporter